MRRGIKTVSAILLAFIMSLSMTACFGGFDAPGYIKDTLDMYKTGTVTDEMAEGYAESKEALQQHIDGEYASLAETFIQEIGEEYATEESKELSLDFAKALCGAMKYEVSDDCEKNDGEYKVKITIYPVDLNDEMDYVLGDFTDDWITERISEFTTEEAAIQAFCEDYLKELIRYLRDTDGLTYADGKEFTVTVSKGSDDKYIYDEDEMGDVIAAAFILDVQ